MRDHQTDLFTRVLSKRFIYWVNKYLPGEAHVEPIQKNRYFIVDSYR